MHSSNTTRRLATAAVLLFGPALLLPAADYKQGHSHRGEVFDEGPRTRPVAMKEIGQAHFPITHKNPETQIWFDQGNTLLHSFSNYEAERAFRWCLKLEPENPMCFWGLARATGDERSEPLIKEAAKRKSTVSERERLYIEALEASGRTDRLRDRGDNPDAYNEKHRAYKKVLETICIRYPEDMEARLMLALANMGDSRYGTEMMLREVEAKQPDHPAVHHYRIHNWNYHEPEQALKSARRYGQIAPNIGHALHMPGHIYSTVGMWKEAAIAMDAATRTEVRHMHEKQVFPFNYWNWGHNRAYLSYIQEQLGEPELAIAGARDLLNAPQDPKHNGKQPYSPFSQGMRTMARALVKYERWKDLLDTRTFPWREIPQDKLLRAYVETRAHLGLNDLDAAEKSFDKVKELEKEKEVEGTQKIMFKELRGRLALAQGETLLGLGLLTEAAEMQYEDQKGDNDPPHYPQVLYNALGDAYLKVGSKDLAIGAFEKALKLTRNDRWAIAGLESAGKDYEVVTAEIERAYKTEGLERFGPQNWSPITAPSLAATDAEGKTVTLDEYRGKDVILIFYLGRECPHCLKQLKDIKRLKTSVLAISPNTPETNKSFATDAEFAGVRFLSDVSKANAKRFLAYDDFEDMELHATLLIDKAGKLRWSRVGGEPFSDIDWLEKEIQRLNHPNP